MGRTKPTQRGASRRSAPSTTKSGGAKRRGSARPRSATSSARRPAGPWVPVIVVGLVVVLGWTLYPALKLQYQASRRQAGLEQQYDSLKQRNEALRAQVAELKTPAGVEKAAREDLGYAKSGEHVYVVMPSASATAGAAATQAVQASVSPSGTSVVRTLLDAIFGVEEPSSNVEP